MNLMYYNKYYFLLKIKIKHSKFIIKLFNKYY